MANILILCWQLLKPNYEKAFTTLICAPKFRALHVQSLNQSVDAFLRYNRRFSGG